MDENSYDVIVIGAGAAGLMAAWEFAQTGKSTAVVEAKDYIGGRIHTIQDKNFDLPVELGAEFVHGDLEITNLILKRAAASQYEITGTIWQNEDGKLDKQKDFIEDFSALNKKLKEVKEDVSVSAFIDNYLQGKEFEETRFTLKNYVEGYYAANPDKASTFALRDELNNSDDRQYRINGGYTKLVGYLADQCKKKGVHFFLSHPVQEIRWKKDEAKIITGKRTLSAKKILITISIGVLQAEAIAFSPTLKGKTNAAKKLGFGPVIKTILQFDEAFWKKKEFTQGKDLDKLSFVFSKAVIPTWWTYHPKDVAMITGWSAGPHAAKMKHLNKKEILQNALESLCEIFSIDISVLQQNLRAWHIADWANDPYNCGGYSYEVVNGKQHQQILKQAVENTIFFAGEGLFEGPEIGTVEAALQTGRETAHQMIASF